MPERTRRALLAVGGSIALAGCLTDLGGRLPDDSTTTRESDTAGDWIERASNSPNPDHSILVRNEASESRTLRVEVVREATGEPVFETTKEVSAGDEFTLYNLREADPGGVETFEVCARLVGEGTTTTGSDSPRRECARQRPQARVGLSGPSAPRVGQSDATPCPISTVTPSPSGTPSGRRRRRQRPRRARRSRPRRKGPRRLRGRGPVRRSGR